jgi:hypothetical protein
MELPRAPIMMRPEILFGDIPVVVIGGVAARAYAPERFTHDIDLLIDCKRFEDATARLSQHRWQRTVEFVFPNSSLGLRGEAWEKDGLLIDIVATPQAWGTEALEIPAYDQTGLRVIPLAYLVLMKLDSARGIDQGDLTRMLGRLGDGEVDAIVKIIEKHSHDSQAPDDVRQYALLGRLEWETLE